MTFQYDNHCILLLAASALSGDPSLIVPPFARPIPYVRLYGCLSVTSQSTVKTVTDRSTVTMGSL